MCWLDKGRSEGNFDCVGQTRAGLRATLHMLVRHGMVRGQLGMCWLDMGRSEGNLACVG